MKLICLFIPSLNKSIQYWSVEHGQQIVHQLKETTFIDNVPNLLLHLPLFVSSKRAITVQILL